MIIRVGAVAALVGVVAGTFLPWVRSGTVDRNSYAAFGALRTLIGFDGTTGAALASWPFLGLACALAAALFVVGTTRTAAVLALIPALAAGGAALAVLRFRGAFGITAVPQGPAVTLCCALILMTICAAALLRRRVRPGVDRSDISA